ncbi:DUF4180 domain-containing protein [Larkinella sp. VNQ87]|uniref:DUF4180 domain-containing protein n=1 Tax=Larkinella sp. VNQ87 TaxID=3400921 RepID=UPI003C015C7C
MEIIETNGVSIAELQFDPLEIRTAQDALDLLANCMYQGADNLIIHEKQLTPDFFELKTGLAGEILQKFSQYGAQLAIIGDYTHYTSKSLRDFMYESNQVGRINFVATAEEAREKLAR